HAPRPLAARRPRAARDPRPRRLLQRPGRSRLDRHAVARPRHVLRPRPARHVAAPRSGCTLIARRLLRHDRLSTALTCDHLVTYYPGVDDDPVFKALADPTRRFLLDRLFERDGRTLTELESELEMTRFGAMKHLRVLEDAGLVVTRRSGREKLHFLNPVPIRLIHDRWIDKYTEHRVAALADLKHELEETAS